MRTLTLFLGLFIVGCFTPLDKEYVTEKFVMDCKQLYDEGYVDSTDVRDMLNYVVFGRLAGQFKPDERRYTLQQVLQEAREHGNKIRYEDSLQRAIQDSLVSVRLAEIEEMLTLADVRVVKKEFNNSGIVDYVILTVQVQNKTEYVLDALKGDIGFYDKFGNEVMTIGVLFSDEVQAHSVKQVTVSVEINHYVEQDALFVSSKLEHLKVNWIPFDVRLK